MAYIEPNSDLALLHDVPLDPDYENTLYFDNISQQTNYFWAKRVHTFSKLSYVRRNRGWIRLGWNADQWPNNTIIQKLYDSTYMMFKNTNFENKWFYAFVDKVEYVNNNTVDVQYHIDVLQTWHFDYEFNQCFIERQHTISDNVGENTIPEQLETGPYYESIANYVLNGQTNNSGQYEFEPGVCLVTSFDPTSLYDTTPDIHTTPVAGKIIYGNEIHGNMYSGCYYTLWPLTTANVTVINEILDRINEKALINGVISIFMFPYDFRASILDSGAAAIKDLSFSRPTTIDSYIPRNRKLYTYPYTFLYVSNNQGNSAEYMYEYFSRGPILRVWGNVSPNAGMMCWPTDYKGMSGSNKDEVLTLTGFPMCSWSYDSFKAWLSQNAGTLTATAVGLGAEWAKIIASGGALGMVGVNGDPYNLVGQGQVQQGIGGNVSNAQLTPSKGLLAATLGAVGQLYDHARKPPQAVGNANLDLNYQAALMTFNFYNKHIKAEYARIIDDYFDMYGYAVHRVGTPNRAARRCWTYIKTVGCSLHGNFPADDLMAIQNLFNNGIRFWKPSAVFGNYNPSVNDNRV